MPAGLVRRCPSRAAAVLALACLATTSCGPAASDAAPGATPSAGTPTRASTVDPPTADPPAPGLAAVAGDAQAGVRGRLLQFRRDVERHRLEVRLVAANAGLVVEGLDLRAPGLTTEPALGPGAVLVPAPGLDLPVTMGPADCTVPPAAPVVSLRLRDGTGAQRTVEVPLEDDGLVQRLHDQDCAEQALRGQADITVVAAQPVRTVRGPAMRVSIELRRLTGTDPVHVTGTGSNTVYDITAVGPLPTLVDGSAVLEVDMVPARCDVHALGESYRTGLIGLVVALGEGAPRPLVLTPADDVRSSLETFAVTTCRTPPD
ncbi:hypothetical protein [Modestobacter excelsi]|uniref:hypothetical protein n=1 Tax=Modestobacter excelsi TaxID=2213161 RepID=UPI00110CF508|nr:hypothetical protein [Modestobacter excelsi]